MSAMIEPISTGWLEREVGVSRPTIAAWRAGNAPRADQLLNLEKALGRFRRRLAGMKEEAAPAVTPERLDKIERYLRAIASATGVPPADIQAIESLHRDAAALRRDVRPSVASSQKAGPHPPGT